MSQRTRMSLEGAGMKGPREHESGPREHEPCGRAMSLEASLSRGASMRLEART